MREHLPYAGAENGYTVAIQTIKAIPRVQMRKFTKRFLRDNEGVTAIEYGLIAGLIALAIAASMSGLATELKSAFSNITSVLSTATGSGSSSGSTN
jgi:pilus assembly protein Flp/PilA